MQTKKILTRCKCLVYKKLREPSTHKTLQMMNSFLAHTKSINRIITNIPCTNSRLPTGRSFWCISRNIFWFDRSPSNCKRPLDGHNCGKQTSPCMIKFLGSPCQDYTFKSGNGTKNGRPGSLQNMLCLFA